MTVLRFTASWCGPCKAMQPIVDKFREKGYDIIDIKLDDEREDVANRNNEFATAAGVLNIPTFIIMNGNEEVKRHSGAMNSIQFEEFLHA